MDQREVESYIKALQKALNEKEPASNVVTIMEKLKKDVAPTEDLLRVCSLIIAHIPYELMWFFKYIPMSLTSCDND
jgi:hypothetical protein